MRQSIFVVFALCLLGGSLAFQFSSESATNVLTCLKLTNALKKNIDLIKTEYTEKDIPDLVVTGYTVIESLQSVLNACQENPIDLHIPQISFVNLHDCVVNAEEVVADLKAIKEDISNKDWINLYKTAKQAVATYATVKEDCSKTSSASLQTGFGKNVLTCLKLTNTLKKNIDLIKTEYTEKDIPDLVVTGYTVIEGLQSLLNACQDSPIDLHIPQISFVNLHDCVVNAEEVVADLKAIQEDISNKDWINLYKTAQQAIATYATVKEDCSKTSSPSLQTGFGKNVLTCLKLTTTLKKNIDLIKTEYTEKDIPDLVVTGYTVVEGLQSLLNACQDSPIDLHIPQITFVNLHDCVVNAEEVVADLKAIQQDISNKDWINLYKTSQQAVATYAVVKEDCSKVSA